MPQLAKVQAINKLEVGVLLETDKALQEGLQEGSQVTIDSEPGGPQATAEPGSDDLLVAAEQEPWGLKVSQGARQTGYNPCANDPVCYGRLSGRDSARINNCGPWSGSAGKSR